jgi:hypothetical protein
VDPLQPSSRKPTSAGISQDMLWVYRKLGGRNALFEAIKNDPEAKKVFLREVFAMSRKDIDGKLKELEDLQQKSRKGGAKEKRAFQFVVKGLYRDGQEVRFGGERKEEDVEAVERGSVPSMPNLDIGDRDVTFEENEEREIEEAEEVARDAGRDTEVDNRDTGDEDENESPDPLSGFELEL